MKKLLIFCIYAAALMAMTVSAKAVSTVYVDDDWAGSNNGDNVGGHIFGTDAFATIQDGVDAVDPGGNVYVEPGNYTQPLLINKAVNIESTSGAIYSTQKGVRSTVPEISIKGLTIIPDNILGEVACVYLSSGSNDFEISECIIDGQNTGASRGILVETGGSYSNVNIHDNEIMDLTTGIYLNTHIGVIDIINNEIHGTLAGIGGLNNANVQGNYFHDNDEAVGTDNSYENAILKNNRFEGNIFGLKNYGSQVIIAEWNYWGDVHGPEFDGVNTIEYIQGTGPGVGAAVVDGGGPNSDKVNNGVDFSPYYTDAAMTNSENIQADADSDYYFNGGNIADSPSGHSPAIQNAILCSFKNDIIEVNYTTGKLYRECVIDRPVTLWGTGADKPVICSGSPSIWSSSPGTVQFINCELRLVDQSRWIRVHGMGDVLLTNCRFTSTEVFTDQGDPISTLVPLPGENTNCEKIYNRILDGCNPTGGTWSYSVNPPDKPEPGPGCVHFNYPNCAPYNNELVLWLDPVGIPKLNGWPVDIWPDNTFEHAPGSEEDAEQFDPKQMPVYTSAVTEDGVEAFPAVMFSKNYSDYGYGFSDIMESPYAGDITSANPNRWEPDHPDYPAESRSLFAVFQLSDDIDDGSYDIPYYADGRQCIFEAGGPLSGYNIYIENGRLVFGMWNRFDKKYIMYQPMTMTALYPLDPDKVYLAQLEYDNDKKQFRGILSTKCDENCNGYETITITSNWVPFQGITMDEDLTGVGGASRTRYHDYTTGESNSDNFRGKIGDIMLYNTKLENASVSVYDFLNQRYKDFGTFSGFRYPLSPLIKDNSQDWIVFSETEYNFDNVLLSSVYPNPVENIGSFSINMPVSQNVHIQLVDIMGNTVDEIFKGQLTKGVHDFRIDASILQNGMYICRVTGENFSKSGKVIVSK